MAQQRDQREGNIYRVYAAQARESTRPSEIRLVSTWEPALSSEDVADAAASVAVFDESEPVVADADASLPVAALDGLMVAVARASSDASLVKLPFTSVAFLQSPPALPTPSTNLTLAHYLHGN